MTFSRLRANGTTLTFNRIFFREDMIVGFVLSRAAGADLGPVLKQDREPIQECRLRYRQGCMS